MCMCVIPVLGENEGNSPLFIIRVIDWLAHERVSCVDTPRRHWWG